MRALHNGFHEIQFRQAALHESASIAAIARRSRKHFLPFLPNLHSFEDEKEFYRNNVFSECQVWVAEENRELVGFCAFRENWVDHLYLLPTHVGKALGAALLSKAKKNHEYLQLWVFQRNTRAIKFYRRHGFLKIRETDGSSNEEKCPDALFEWRKRQ